MTTSDTPSLRARSPWRAAGLPAEAHSYFRWLRPLAPVLCAVAFLVLGAVTDLEVPFRLAVVMALSAAVGATYHPLARRFDPRSVATASVFVDTLVIALIVAQTPHPEEFTLAYAWGIGLAVLFLTPRWILLLGALIAVLCVIVPLLHPSELDLFTVATAVIIVGAVIPPIAMAQAGDVSRRRALQRSERQLREAQRVAAIGSWEWQPSTGELVWSDEMYRLLGHDPARATAAPGLFYEGMDEVDRPRVRDAIGRLIQHDAPYDVTYGYRRADGTRGVMRAQGVRREAFDSGERWIVGTGQDVTALHEAERLKDEFVATASHELRTPTTIVTGFAQTLDERWEELDELQRRSFIAHIRSGADRLARLIEDVLHVSRIEARSQRVRADRFDLVDLLDEAVGERVDPRVVLSPVEHDELQVLADRDWQREVVDNLLDNAERFAREDGSIVVSARAAGDRAVVVVEDDGPGVPADQREFVFERFARIEGPDARGSFRGTGLGLYITRNLIELQGGRISVSDSELGGARFSFDMPLAAADAPD